MSTTALRPSVRRAHPPRGSRLALLGGVLALALALTSAPGSPAGAAERASGRLAEQPAAATVFQISSFNLLGAAHTKPRGKKPQFASGKRRMAWATQIIEQDGLDVIGFQEMERPQYDRFQQLKSTEFGIYPGIRLDGPARSNSIAWRLSEWSLVDAMTYRAPYFHGRMQHRPVVRLENRATGQQIYVLNTHNPASVRGPAQRWRDKAVAIQVQLINQLRTESPEVPVFFLGDMNDKAKFFCPVVSTTDLHAADGGTYLDGVCTPPVPTRIDWIMGSAEVAFTSYTARKDALVSQTTDHPVVMATASIPPPAMQASSVRRIVVIDVEGLSSRAVRRAGATRAPNLYRMMAQGASTLNARTATERTTSLPNIMSMLTGRRVRVSAGGHGVRSNVDNGSTVRATAGRYISSTYDLVHNFGQRTALLSSKPQIQFVARSWDATNGGLDPYGLDDGRNKITRVVQTPDDQRLANRLTRMVAKAPKAFTFAHVSMLADVGRERGWHRPRYMRTLTEVDAMVGRLLDTVSASPSLKASTLVVVTADGGGVGTTQTDPSAPSTYTVPLLVWGPDVVAGADLYAINPAYSDPGTARVGYRTAGQPIRTATVANLVTAVLKLPVIPGSQVNNRQDFNIFVGSR